MVYNEPDFLPIWVRHYGNQVGLQNCFVVDHGSDDGSTYGLGPVNVVRIPRSEFDERKRAASISDFCASLLQWYDFVAYTDVDELLVPDPAIAADLPAFCTPDRPEVTTAVGLDLFHFLGHEMPLELSRPFLSQRRAARVGSNMCKPSLIRCPIRWDTGFHSYPGPAVFGGLYLFHLATVDLAIAQRRQLKRQKVVENHPYELHPHKMPPSYPQHLMERWSAMEMDDTDAVIEDVKARVIASQTSQDNGDFHINLDIDAPKTWRIPERFRSVGVGGMKELIEAEAFMAHRIRSVSGQNAAETEQMARPASENLVGAYEPYPFYTHE
jgi:hypothetical protein